MGTASQLLMVASPPGRLVPRALRPARYRRPVSPSPEFPPRNVICAGAVVLSERRCLLVHEASGRLAGQWGIPWGFVEAGETPDAAAARETLEEAGVVIRVTSLLGAASLRNPTGALGMVFAGELDPADQSPRGDGVETLEARFFSAGDLDDKRLRIEPWCGWVVRRALSGRLGVPRALDGPSPLPTFL